MIPAEREVRRLAVVAHPFDSRQRYLAVFIAYFDESFDADLFTLAGFVSSESRWRKFVREWSVALREYSISEFKMSDFEHDIGEFRGWKQRDPQGRVAFISRLAAIICSRVRLGVSVSVPISEYRRIIVPSLSPGDDLFKQHYVFCMHACLEWINSRKSVLALGREDRIACVFDEHFGVHGNAVEHFRRLKGKQPWGPLFHGISFEDSKEFLPLQAADILAYENFKEMKNRVLPENPLHAQRKLFERLAQSSRLLGAYSGAEHLMNIAGLWRSGDKAGRMGTKDA